MRVRRGSSTDFADYTDSGPLFAVRYPPMDARQSAIGSQIAAKSAKFAKTSSHNWKRVTGTCKLAAQSCDEGSHGSSFASSCRSSLHCSFGSSLRSSLRSTFRCIFRRFLRRTLRSSFRRTSRCSCRSSLGNSRRSSFGSSQGSSFRSSLRYYFGCSFGCCPGGDPYPWFSWLAPAPNLRIIRTLCSFPGPLGPRLLSTPFHSSLASAAPVGQCVVRTSHFPGTRPLLLTAPGAVPARNPQLETRNLACVRLTLANFPAIPSA
jgi:hypothetical protein